MDPLQTDHRQAWDLIPWVVNGTASAAEREIVDIHQRGCADCRAEFEFQQQLRSGMQSEAGDEEVDGALQGFWQRADAQAPAHPALDAARPAANGRWQRALVAAVVVQAIGLAGALGVIWEQQRPADYQVLSQPGSAPAAARIRLVPAPGLQIGELRALLARSDLQLVQASADAGHLGLALAPGARFDLPEVLQRLRAEPGVLLAEPLR